MLRPAFGFLCLIFLVNSAQAEYRVFLLKISKAGPPAAPGQPAQPGESREVTSTLDPIQYPLYYPLAAGETVSYTETWRCRGRTDQFKPYCPNPKQTQAATQPQNQPQSPAPSAKP